MPRKASEQLQIKCETKFVSSGGDMKVDAINSYVATAITTHRCAIIVATIASQWLKNPFQVEAENEQKEIIASRIRQQQLLPTTRMFITRWTDNCRHLSWASI